MAPVAFAGQGLDLQVLLVGQLALQPDEFFSAADALGDIDFLGAGQRQPQAELAKGGEGERAVLVADEGRLGAQRDGQDLAVAVGDGAALGMKLLDAMGLGLDLGHVGGVVEHLHVEQLETDGEDPEKEKNGQGEEALFFLAISVHGPSPRP